MTQDEKVALLRQAGVWDVIGFPGCIDKLIDIVAAYEREACAKLLEDAAYTGRIISCTSAAKAIRARSEK